MKTLLSILLLGVLVGCAASSPEEARELGPDRRYVFQVDRSYQKVYQTILDNARKCWQGPVGTAMQMVNGDLYPDSRTGTISVGMYGAMGPQLYQVIDVRGTEGDRTEVVAMFPFGPVDKLGPRLKVWAEGSSSECNPPSVFGTQQPSTSE